jgi:putative membrane protein
MRTGNAWAIPSSFRKESLMRIGSCISACSHVLLAALLAGCAGGNPQQSQRAAPAASVTGGLTQSDLRLLADLAQTNIAEVQTGKLALSRSTNPQVRAFAQSVVNDHGEALQDLQRFAEAQGLLLPEGTDLIHKAVAADLALLSGPDFDRQYLSMFGIADHKSLLGLLDQTLRTAIHPSLKAHAQKYMPMVARHLELAQQLAARPG